MGAALCACAGRGDDEPGLYRSALHSHHGKQSSTHKVGGRVIWKSPKDDSLLQTQSRAETRELLSDEEREALLMRHHSGMPPRGTHTGAAATGVSTGNNYNFHHSNGAAYAAYGGYAFPPDDHADGTESDEIEYYNRLQQQQQQQQQNGTGGAGGLTLSLPTRRRAPMAMMSQHTADAFHRKLREQIMSPRSKMLLLVDANDDKHKRTSAVNPEDDDERSGGGGADSAAVSPSHLDLQKCQQEDKRDSEARTRRMRVRTDSAAIEDVDVSPATEATEDQDDTSGDCEDHQGDDVDEEEEYFEYIRIIVPPGPCGVVFKPPTGEYPSMPPTVDGFVRMYDGSKGPIENCCLVHKGSTLCAINDLNVTNLPLTEVVRALNLSAHLEREFVFKK